MELKYDPVFKKRNDLHLARKIWHIVMGSTAVSIYYEFALPQITWAIIAAVCAFLALTTDIIRLYFPKINRYVFFIMGPFMRESEKNSFSGVPYYASGISLSLFLYDEKMAILSIFFLVFADPISSYFGILYGKDRIIPGKSWQGSFACFVTCTAIATAYGLFFTGPSVELTYFCLLGGLIGAISELFSGKIDDNLTIPVLSGLGLSFLDKLFNVF
ncbi:MAG: hypothetical protein H6622_00610 [Halobacteriovoraceae bacterium]|nr:hypothetical protein [Halobacteriovoraceae bacterium]